MYDGGYDSPIQRKNEWITSKGSEYTKFHAFINCQALKLTANRGSIENTPSEILQDLEQAVREIYESIVQGDDWDQLEWLESEVDSVNTIYSKLKEHNYPITFEIEENWYRQDDKLLGNKEFLVQDPDGYLLRFSEDLGEKEVI